MSWVLGARWRPTSLAWNRLPDKGSAKRARAESIDGILARVGGLRELEAILRQKAELPCGRLIERGAGAELAIEHLLDFGCQLDGLRVWRSVRAPRKYCGPVWSLLIDCV